MRHNQARGGYPIPPRHRFSAWRALRGKHSPRRVIVRGAPVVVGGTLMAIALLGRGAPSAIFSTLYRFGVTPELSALVLLGLMAGCGLVWIWFLVSLWTCAPNSGSRRGYHLTRRIAMSLAILIAAAIVLLVAMPATRGQEDDVHPATLTALPAPAHADKYAVRHLAQDERRVSPVVDSERPAASPGGLKR